MLKLLNIIFICFLCSCNYFEFGHNQKISYKLVNSCKNIFPCSVRLAEISGFEWDSAFVFSYEARKIYIEQIIGTSLPGYDEFTQKIVFIKNGNIVYIENNDVDIEGVKNGELIFDIHENSLFRKYDANVVFEITLNKSNMKTYYNLIQLKGI